MRRRGGGESRRGLEPSAPDRESEEWVDLGPVEPTDRQSRPRNRRKAERTRRPATVRILDEVVDEFETALGSRLARSALRQYEVALVAFEGHRYSDARKELSRLARSYPTLIAVRDLLGLCLYREGKWKDAIKELEIVRKARPGSVFNHPVLADCYRAEKLFDMVEELWIELGEVSPAAETMAEGRIVLAGSYIDRGHLDRALEVMRRSDKVPRRVEEHHLRQWYVLADILDRRGDTIGARRLFERIAGYEPSFADVGERLAVLGG